MPKLTEKEIKERVFKNTLKTCEYIGGYENQESTIKIKCKKHNYEFETKWANVRKDNKAHYVCPFCKFEKARTEVECAYCHKKFFTLTRKMNRSKTGNHYCCREHQDLAKITTGTSSFWYYRKNAFKNYPHECAICKWNEDDDVLEVHHIDENRQNNEIDNLIILCPTCHKKLTTGKYKLINREKIVLKDS